VGLALFTGMLLTSSVTSQTSLTFVKDINLNPSTTLTNSYPYPARPSTTVTAQKWAQMGGWSYIQASTASTGYELYKSDGKQAILVADIRKGSNGSSPSNITVVGSNLFFTANNGVNGTELWMSNGTAAGTKMVKDIRPGTNSSSPAYLTRVLGRIVFRANDGTNGTELWVSDGTAAGTTMLMDIQPGSGNGSPTYIQSNFVTNMAFFYANDGRVGSELWVTNGTAAGTKLLKDINLTTATASSYPRYFQHLGGIQVVFEANDGVNGQELWVTDGTAANTKLVADIYAGANSGTYCTYGVSLGSKVLFRGRSATAGYEAWITDGTAAGTMMLKDVNIGSAASGYVYYPCVDGKTAYYGATNGAGYQIYVTDGTPVGTKLFSSATMSTGSPSYLYASGGTVWFSGKDVTPGTGYEICSTDGTTTKTFQDTWKGSKSGYGYYCSEIAKGIIGFRASDGVTGSELWVTDGTTAGTKLIDINPPLVPAPTDNDNVKYIESLFGKLIFAASDGRDKTKGQTGQELWISDGTSTGTKLLKDIYVGTSTTSANDSNPSYMCRYGNYVYFAANNGINGTELWRTDGTTAGTNLFLDINIVTTTASSYPQWFTQIGSKMYFNANNGTTGNELWVSDGTVAGTKMVKDIYAGTSSSSPRYFARFGLTNRFAFQAYDNIAGSELWISDGTAAGTKMVKDIRAGTTGSYPEFMHGFGDKIYFQCNDGTRGYELWESNGTAAGTKLIKDNYPGSSSGYARYVMDQNGALYFYGTTPTTGYEVMTSDGTAAGTNVFWDLNPGVANTYPYYLTAVGSRRIYFRGEYTVGSVSYGAEPMFFDVSIKPATVTAFDANPNGHSYPYNQRGGRYEFAVDSGNVYMHARDSVVYDNQLVKIVNGGTSQSIGRVADSSVMTATDARIGQNLAMAGATSVPNPLSVLCLGVPNNKPASLGTFVPDSYAYFQVANFFWIVGNLPGKAWATVLPVPNDSSLLSLTAVLQAFSLDALKFPAGTEVTNGVHLTMGK